MAEKLIKIDELRPIVFMLIEERITYGKACELISQICKDKALIINTVVVPKGTLKPLPEDMQEALNETVKRVGKKETDLDNRL